MIFKKGSIIVVYMKDPREKYFGVFYSLNSSGLLMKGLDLSSFDDFSRHASSGEQDCILPSSVFIPMGRIEKIYLDEGTENMPSLSVRFKKINGKSLKKFLGEKED